MDSELYKLNNKEKKKLEDISDTIWEYAETKYEEYNSSKIQMDYMEQQGFSITRKLGGIKTAFLAKTGSGKPVIALLGEFDALPGLSQTVDVAVEMPEKKGGAGHGCGHNLLGVGSMEAAVVLKKYIEKNNISGTVIYYGCPAEESGAGKAFMVRANCFQNVDFALTWHPYSQNGIMNESLSNIRVIFEFFGKSAHASANPEEGRSALDACELMNVGVNYLREHVTPQARMHYAYLDAGGKAPNIVPHKASVLYALRAPQATYVQELLNRVSDIAKGAALMTGTMVNIKVVSAYSDILAVLQMDNLLRECMGDVIPITYTEEEYAYANKYVDENMKIYANESINNTIAMEENKISMGSTDVGDVSWNVPTGSIYVTTMSVGSTMHGWSVVAQGKSSIAHKGMHAAAQILAEAGIRILKSEELQRKILHSFEQAKGTQQYKSMIPENVLPGEF